MKKKEIIDFAEGFKTMIESKHHFEITSPQEIANLGLEFECGDIDGKGISKISEAFFDKGLTLLITAQVLQQTKIEVRWDEVSDSPLIMNSNKIVNVKHDIVKAYDHGKCCFNIAHFLNSILMGSPNFNAVETEAPLPLSAPGQKGGNYNLIVDDIVELQTELLDEDIRGQGLYGEGSCHILSIQEMEEIGEINSVNVFDEFAISLNPDLPWLPTGLAHWLVGWFLYIEEGFKLGFCNPGIYKSYSALNLSDGYSTFEVISLFDKLFKTRTDGNPFKVVKPLYEHMMSVKRANREKAWLFASNI